MMWIANLEFFDAEGQHIGDGWVGLENDKKIMERVQSSSHILARREFPTATHVRLKDDVFIGVK